ncbi:MAG: ABC transporter permease, partial [Chloroflexota bacterium]
YFFTLVMTPLMFFSGVFFPITRLPAAVQGAVWLSPLYHAANLFRALAHGQLTGSLAYDGLALVATAVVACSLSLALMRRRLIV